MPEDPADDIRSFDTLDAYIQAINALPPVPDEEEEAEGIDSTFRDATPTTSSASEERAMSAPSAK